MVVEIHLTGEVTAFALEQAGDNDTAFRVVAEVAIAIGHFNELVVNFRFGDRFERFRQSSANSLWIALVHDN